VRKLRKIKAIYTASDDTELGTLETEAILIAPDVLIETEDGLPWTFLIIPPVPDDQDTVEVDRAKCGYFSLGLSHIRREEDFEPDFDFIEKASLLDFVRRYANK
jgi:hypothetical protein